MKGHKGGFLLGDGGEAAARGKGNLVLLSGGLDSAVNLLLALRRGGVALALTVDYGQRAARKERERAAALCAMHDVRHEVIEARWVARFSGDALTGSDRQLPRPGRRDLENPAWRREAARAVWVPNRNGLLVHMGACLAEALGIPFLVMGLNAEEGAAFPDNSPAFVREMNRALGYSTRSRVRLRSFTLHWNKEEIMRAALRLGLPLELTWPCYNGGDLWCGKCESCLRFRAAAEALGESRRLRGLFSS
ncbi:7-cyano-7-deazaguanine synthase QueC [Candidatus Solincola tengchongensis]|uniref:7-cyano-7-deazaguanine synthase QueC n=1 Tax=Candidatus Solincola tengchongensis TaxID=2900693 RepID=UPI00257A11E2|nr:7-cyano-7-deazaguanine synthase QueC [Candidatus Solincola tengchongensis]